MSLVLIQVVRQTRRRTRLVLQKIGSLSTSYLLFIHQLHHFQSIITTLRPKLRPHREKHPRNDHHRHSNKPQQTRRPPNSQRLVHLYREQRKRRSQAITHEAISSESRRAAERSVDVYEVQSAGDEDSEIAPGEGDAGERGDYPVDVGAGGPGEPKETGMKS